MIHSRKVPRKGRHTSSRFPKMRIDLLTHLAGSVEDGDAAGVFAVEARIRDISIVACFALAVAAAARMVIDMVRLCSRKKKYKLKYFEDLADTE